MTWFANSPIVSVILATGVAWIAPQFLAACTGYTIIMFMFVIIARTFATSYFWTSEVGLFSISLALGYLAIIISSVIRGFVYHIISRAMKMSGRETTKENVYVGNEYAETYMHYMKMIASPHGWQIPGFNNIFYVIFAVVMSLIWGALVFGVSWFFYYYETMVGIWPWCFLHIGIAAIVSLVVFAVEYQMTENKTFTGARAIESTARVCTLATIMIQFPIAIGLYMMFYMIFHPMAWFSTNESVIVLMGMASYCLANVLFVYVATYVFSNTRHRGLAREHEVDLGELIQ